MSEWAGRLFPAPCASFIPHTSESLSPAPPLQSFYWDEWQRASSDKRFPPLPRRWEHLDSGGSGTEAPHSHWSGLETLHEDRMHHLNRLKVHFPVDRSGHLRVTNVWLHTAFINVCVWRELLVLYVAHIAYIVRSWPPTACCFKLGFPVRVELKQSHELTVFPRVALFCSDGAAVGLFYR